MIENVPDPGPAGAGEVTVAMEAAAVTHLDLTLTSGTFAYRPGLPFVPGTAGAGRVIGGEAALRGRRVLVRGGGVGLERPGTWAQRVTAPVTAVRKVPEDVDAALAATCYSPMTTAWAAVGPLGAVQEGERVLVTGASGGVGSLAVQLAARAKAHVLALVRNERQAAAVPDGAHETLIGSGPEALAAAAADGGIDVLLDTVGGDTLPTFLPALRPGSRAVLIGYVAGRTLTLDLPALLARDVTLLPVNMVRRQVPDDVFHRLLSALGDGSLRLNTTTHPFDDLPRAITARTHGSVSGTLAVTM
ncbi:zinc-binding alcohol dehydrogenase family protein [Streptomyces sp. CRN 30]|uniref:quinone oxidoreductase family protein n=1 Tax=Streptomyces sp. CRN 30 TaxID=3075613 RepID=UPI002A81D615|nr:zinc-binding alcohol dehydrogenase family protein [Streptomyces sp. CRN 30]